MYVYKISLKYTLVSRTWLIGQWDLLITIIQETDQKWPLCTGDRYRQVGYNMGSLVGTY